MNFCKNLIGAILLLFLGACSTSKEVVYFQDLRPGESELALTDPVEIKIQPKDKLSILVNSHDLRLTNLFNLPIVSQQIGDVYKRQMLCRFQPLTDKIGVLVHKVYDALVVFCVLVA